MKKMIQTLLGITLLTLTPTISHAMACQAATKIELLKAFAAPVANCNNIAHPGYRSIEILAGTLTLNLSLDVPDNTRIYGVAPLPADPYNPPSKIVVGADVQGYGLRLGNNSELSNLDIQYQSADPTKPTPLLAIVLVGGNFNTVKQNIIKGSAATGILLGYPLTTPPLLASYNVIGLNNVVADQGTGIVVRAGFNNAIIANAINVASDKTFAGKNGLLLADWPQLLIENNILAAAADGNMITFNNHWLGTPMPIGIAANLIASNTSLSTDKKYIALKSADTNFESYFKKPLSDLPTCASKDKTPYHDDGTCKAPMVAKTCPASQALLPDGTCGCVEGTALDSQLNVCVKTVTVEKVVEKIIEKPVEKIVEKLVLDASKNGIQPIVANPTTSGSGCSLMR